MTLRGRTIGWLATAVTLVAVTTAIVVYVKKTRPLVLKGAVLSQNADPRKQLPIGDVEINAAGGIAPASTKSDGSGYFSLTLNKGIRRRRPIVLTFRHSEYEPLTLNEFTSDKLYVVRMVPTPRKPEPNRPQSVVTNVSARYSIKTTSIVNVGSSVKSFEVVNTANVPCNKQPPCSPDGKWKAAIGSVSLDAGEGNEFRNARASCIAGPCPFTRIEQDDFSQGGRTINVSIRNWSDTTTFLAEAEVFHPMVGDLIRRSYPVIFGPVLNFTLPAAAEGVSIEADMDGRTIVFPLGPSLRLSWAECNARVNRDQTKVFRCELKPGYRFPQ